MTFTLEPHVKGLIFDSDGTLVNTMPLHYRAFLETFESTGEQFPEELFYELAGVPTDRIIEVLNEKFGYKLDPKEITRKKEKIFLKKYLPQAQPIEPVINIAKANKGRMPMAVATGGIPMVVNNAMRAIGMTGFFDTIVTAEDVTHGKPAPDIFLEAARRIGVEPQYCQVFEDSDAGLEAAQRAGMVATDVRLWLNGNGSK